MENATCIVRQGEGIRPSSPARLLATLVALLTATACTFAGQYNVTYSGGANGVTIQPTGYGSWTKNYALSDGWYKGTGWCYTTIPGDPPTYLATAGTVYCSGTITATFTWSGEDAPPSSIVVKEECVANFAGSSGNRDTTHKPNGATK